MATSYTFEFDMVNNNARLGYGKRIASKKDDQGSETYEAFEDRCWKERVHVDANGHLFIPAMAVKRAMETGATSVGRKIPGRGAATYAKRFRSGIMVLEDAIVMAPETGRPLTMDDVEFEWLDVPSDGKVGGPIRVLRKFPFVEKGKWMLHVSIHVLDGVITPEALTEAAHAAGMSGGLGRYRPGSQSGGCYGRFVAKNFSVRRDPAGQEAEVLEEEEPVRRARRAREAQPA